MQWQLFLSTFMSIFLAELGDKTQIATFSLASAESSKLTIFLGSSLALVLTSAIAVTAGSYLGQFMSPVWIQRIAGSVFIILGAFYLIGSFSVKA